MLFGYVDFYFIVGSLKFFYSTALLTLIGQKVE